MIQYLTNEILCWPLPFFVAKKREGKKKDKEEIRDLLERRKKRSRGTKREKNMHSFFKRKRDRVECTVAFLD